MEFARTNCSDSASSFHVDFGKCFFAAVDKLGTLRLWKNGLRSLLLGKNELDILLLRKNGLCVLLLGRKNGLGKRIQCRLESPWASDFGCGW